MLGEAIAFPPALELMFPSILLCAASFVCSSLTAVAVQWGRGWGQREANAVDNVADSLADVVDTSANGLDCRGINEATWPVRSTAD